MGKVGGSNCYKNNDRRSQNKISFPSSSNVFSPSKSLDKRVTTPFLKAFYSRVDRSESYKKDNSPSTPVFFQSVCSRERRGVFSSHYRPFVTKQVSDNPNIQDGDSWENCQEYSGNSMGLYHRSKGRVFSRSNKLVFPEVSSLYGGRSDLCVSVPPVWSVHSSVDVYKDYKANKGSSPQNEDSNSFFFGRFSSASKKSRRVIKDNCFGFKSFQRTGSSDKFQEVSDSSFSEGSVSRGTLPSRLKRTFASRRESNQDSESLQRDFSRVSSLSSPIRAAFRPPKFCFSSSPSRTASPSSSFSLDECPYKSGIQRQTSASGRCLQESFKDLGKHFIPQNSSSYEPSNSFYHSDDRCSTEWLGRSYPSRQDKRVMESERKETLNKLERVKSDRTFSKILSELSKREVSPGEDRQYYSSVMYSKPGYFKINTPSRSFQSPSGILPIACNYSDSQASSRRFECLGRSGFSPESYFDRMVNRPKDFQIHFGPEWPIQVGCFRNKRKYPSENVHFSFPRPSSLWRECPLARLVPVGRHLSFSSSSITSRSISPSRFIQRKRGSNSPLISSCSMVSEHPSQNQGTLPLTSFPLPVSNDIRREGLSRESFFLSSSRLDTISRALRKKGFLEGPIDTIRKAWKEKTINQYQGVWKKFLNFLTSQEIAHEEISVATVCSFLDLYGKDLKREYRTLASYKSALRHPLLFAKDVEINQEVMSLFMRGIFNLNPPKRAKEMPVWSLTVLLEFLVSKEFEPLEQASSLRLTQKVLCLVLLSSGRRISEVTNISRLSVEKKFPPGLSLNWLKGFRAKTYSPKFQPPNPSISYLISNRASDILLCPVRAYKIYVLRSLDWLEGVPLGIRPMSLWSIPSSPNPASILFLTKIFKSVVEDSRKDKFLTNKVPIGPHQMRKFAASYANKVGQVEDRIRINMGFSSLKILRKNYVAKVPDLKIHCVLPGGTFIPERTL